jgi:hypothetical protein
MVRRTATGVWTGGRAYPMPIRTLGAKIAPAVPKRNAGSVWRSARSEDGVAAGHGATAGARQAHDGRPSAGGCIGRRRAVRRAPWTSLPRQPARRPESSPRTPSRARTCSQAERRSRLGVAKALDSCCLITLAYHDRRASSPSDCGRSGRWSSSTKRLCGLWVESSRHTAPPA